ncbi:hypothetical protein INS49_010939 [Diaporthe citri]|uniref:uncharacterized protein n=1 Tax=Diaporthe citri TaxID=83186 RepID=UPI001C80E10A|nr:uncharacterized protein INS49_010939 [Diaporthe citri]KAG6359886.1 hypothetical protein INS49_010939 [Diaporthe citri]
MSCSPFTFQKSRDMAENFEFSPNGYPPFPSDLPKAHIEKISLRQLLEQNDDEVERFFVACQKHGFFYVNLRDHPKGKSLEDGAVLTAQIAEETFQLPLEEKKKYHQAYNGSIYGYKMAGAQKTDVQGTPDTVEFMSISKDFIVNNTASPNQIPPTIHGRRTDLKPFVAEAHAVGDRHRIGHRSGSQLRMTRSPPIKKNLDPEKQIATTAHTDLGSITILFNWLGGLQMWEPEHPDGNKFWSASRLSKKGRWVYVEPIPGFAIVNLGDAMTKFTNGVLNSGKHRVLPAPGQQEDFVRYSVAYFVRPEDEAVLKVLEAAKIPKWEGDKEEKTFGQHVLDFGRAKYGKDLVKIYEEKHKPC